jgi:hypothetical protein
MFPTQAITELASEFKLLRKDIQAIRSSLEKIEKGLCPLLAPTKNYEK